MTSRKYDASRRIEAAQRTREAILAAAFRLHGRSIYDMESLAAEANVSVATVRKHFPTRELLFESCTDWGMHTAVLPDLDLIGSVEEPAARTRLAVLQTYAFHESLFGQAWGAFKLEDESPALARILQRIEGLVGILADLVVEVWPIEAEQYAEVRGLVAGFLSPLTYRALKVHGGLSAEKAVERSSDALISALSMLMARARKEAANA